MGFGAVQSEGPIAYPSGGHGQFGLRTQMEELLEGGWCLQSWRWSEDCSKLSLGLQATFRGLGKQGNETKEMEKKGPGGKGRNKSQRSLKAKSGAFLEGVLVSSPVERSKKARTRNLHWMATWRPLETLTEQFGGSIGVKL